MDKIEKALQKLRPKEKETFKQILADIRAERTQKYDIKKLKGRDDIFRIRKGDMRIIFSKTDTLTKILVLEKRSEATYKIST
ncbi:MAG: hypothetical protein A2249_00340 [Candidatus Jacksonbacteria bacterium RIFOXYA2_FULL_44_7]|uniref:Addiction module toxin RelE n=1 Tax=Candidatus Jacksonbacteria bacterium RIFCSPLOWO2_02_FULL_44_20 TaxID=1798460 RepID=A0A1G2A6V0_9BACT|nr:MAG: hypothetical protein UW39_C0004G0028 [Parcubacteria group bacterium GW2011_GWC2_44_17]OGY69922.1 MAG: hypothetical protein A3C00_02840 [Candidatus Jacksonbacteria bacterium RIFCSPHIGHO2_02_FULL_44_25]OGY70181.1 MAG: hypothetical protein A3E05_03090 [Candidatus Jacksonbacteria bacterium RIFCSPHIGHO2_12_FULL_44_12]OGY72405.1 MAG: hypothetical protein A3H61_03750 [Candidatus Jacksonbacteria bacterium RIFCSPLOWO2_02_FULL_44_20]OGY73769.1 MAG: hypothetical protein A3H07_02440 [Candidatus Jac